MAHDLPGRVDRYAVRDDVAEQPGPDERGEPEAAEARPAQRSAHPIAEDERGWVRVGVQPAPMGAERVDREGRSATQAAVRFRPLRHWMCPPGVQTGQVDRLDIRAERTAVLTVAAERRRPWRLSAIFRYRSVPAPTRLPRYVRSEREP
jgi:hypothetical protein